MKQIAEQANDLIEKMQMVANSLADYNPGLHKERTPLQVIQHDLACIGKELTWLYAEIEKKVRNEINSNS